MSATRFSCAHSVKIY